MLSWSERTNLELLGAGQPAIHSGFSHRKRKSVKQYQNWQMMTKKKKNLSWTIASNLSPKMLSHLLPFWCLLSPIFAASAHLSRLVDSSGIANCEATAAKLPPGRLQKLHPLESLEYSDKHLNEKKQVRLLFIQTSFLVLPWLQGYLPFCWYAGCQKDSGSHRLFLQLNIYIYMYVPDDLCEIHQHLPSTRKTADSEIEQLWVFWVSTKRQNNVIRTV